MILYGHGAEKGQLGDGSTTDKSNPVQIGSESDWGSLGGWKEGTFAIKAA